MGTAARRLRPRSMARQSKFRSLSTLAGVVGILLLLCALVLRTAAVFLFGIAAAVFLLAMVFSFVGLERRARFW